MPKDKNFKRRVRARMADTGERYTTAREQLKAGTDDADAPPGQVVSLASLGTLLARCNLVRGYAAAGRPREAVALAERVVADAERYSTDVLTARAILGARTAQAAAYRAAGRTEEAVDLCERLVAEAQAGPGGEWVPHCHRELAAAYRAAGRTTEAAALEQALADARPQRQPVPAPPPGSEIVRPAKRPRTHRAGPGATAGTAEPARRLPTEQRTRLWSDRRLGELVDLQEQLVADLEHALGRDHPDALAARETLAKDYSDSNCLADAVRMLEEIAADCARLFGDDHPKAIDARALLVYDYERAGRLEEAIDMAERVLADRERVLGPDDGDTLHALTRLGTVYWKGGRRVAAIEAAERVLTDCERLAGPDGRPTNKARTTLADRYAQVGRLDEAAHLFAEIEARHRHPIARLEAVVDKDVEEFSAWFAHEDATFLAIVTTRFLDGLISRLEYVRDPASMRAAAGEKPHARIKVVTTLFEGRGGEVNYKSLGGPDDDFGGASQAVLNNRIGLLLGAKLLETVRD